MERGTEVDAEGDREKETADPGLCSPSVSVFVRMSLWKQVHFCPHHPRSSVQSGQAMGCRLLLTHAGSALCSSLSCNVSLKRRRWMCDKHNTEPAAARLPHTHTLSRIHAGGGSALMLNERFRSSSGWERRRVSESVRLISGESVKIKLQRYPSLRTPKMLSQLRVVIYDNNTFDLFTQWVCG